jgi:phosphoribosylformylglycinamidine synthase
MPVYRLEITPRPEHETGRGRTLIHTAHQLGLTGLTTCHPSRLIFLQGNLSEAQVQRIGAELLADPVTERLETRDLRLTDTIASLQSPVSNLPISQSLNLSISPFIETTLLPGVTDPPAENLVRAAHLLGIAGLERAATGERFVLEGDVDAAALQRLATELFANPVIQRTTINELITPPFFAYQLSDEKIETISLRNVNDAELLSISKERRLALDLAEMQAIQRYFRDEGRDPTDTELEMLAQTWSEHCVHKTFRATIDYLGPLPGQTNSPTPQRINGLLKSLIRQATETLNKPWVRSAFVDNAGIISFDDQFDLAFKVETHNHPSALEPFGGANTGVGGVVRDVLGVSARPIANTDILCFGPPDLPHDRLPEGVLHPRRIADGVIHGIEDYGNKMGIPTVNGSINYHEGYTANPLVYCGCLGLLPRDSNPTQVQVGDLIVAVGGRTGRDGLRGATFSSMEMDVTTSEIAGTAVQIGNPIMEKQVQEVILRARDEQLYNAITDCGAGGFSSAVGEMGKETGAKVQLQAITLKYPGLRPWEMWLSEAQERMVLAVPAEKWPQLQAICAGQDVEAIQLGIFDGSGRVTIYYGDKLVGDLDAHFLHEGIPQRHLKAEWQPVPQYRSSLNWFAMPNFTEMLIRLLAHPNVRSKEDTIRRYDHEIQGGAAAKPLVGTRNHGPGDATVLVPQAAQTRPLAYSQTRGVALSNGICPSYGEIDPYAMAWAAVDEAVRNAVAVGADPEQIAILDNFCWGNPNLPDRLGSLVRCTQGCYDAALAYEAPFISGKDSLNNEYTGADGQKHAIPGTLLISALAIVPDVAHTVTMDLKAAGNLLYVLGETKPELGGTLFTQQQGLDNGIVPQPVHEASAHYRALHQAMRAGLVQSAHDCSEGGLAVALAEMSLAGELGVAVDLALSPQGENLSLDEVLFAESQGRLVLEVKEDDAAAFEAMMNGVPCGRVGHVTPSAFTITYQAQLLIQSTPIELEQAWRGHLAVNREPLAVSSEQLAVSSKQSQVSSLQSLSPQHSALSTQHSLPSRPRVLILHANGTNRDHDAALACALAGGEPEIVHINQLLAGERHFSDYHMLIVPGGFSYGDDMGAGVLWAMDLRHRFGERVQRFVESGRPVLGICNGFQTLVKAGLLPGKHSALSTQHSALRPTTLTYNASAHFECRWVYLQADTASPCLFTQGLEELVYCPVAHGEGRVAVNDAGVAAALQAQHLIPLTYVNRDGSPAEYPANPNGSVFNIAALCNPAGNVMGLMPHPENHIFPWQHPRWRRGEGGMLGLRLFENGVKAAKQ